MNEEVKIKISQPMFEVGELERFDNNIHSIIEEYSKLMFKEKDQILTQRIIMKQEEEIERLKEEYVMLQNASDEVEEEKDKEIERLQDLCNKYEKEHKTTYEIWKKDIYLYNSMVDRIDKAIEYITTEQLYTNYQWGKSQYVKILKDLLDILKGSE